MLQSGNECGPKIHINFLYHVNSVTRYHSYTFLDLQFISYNIDMISFMLLTFSRRGWGCAQEYHQVQNVMECRSLIS